MSPNRLSYESAGLAIGVGVVLFTALVTVRGQPGWSSPGGVMSDLGESTGTEVVVSDTFFDPTDIVPFLAGVGITDASNLTPVVVDYGGVNIDGGKKLSAASDSSMLSAEPTVVMFDPDAPSREGDGSGPGTAGPWLHALWTGCKGGDTDQGEVVVEYNPPAPPSGTGEHRYIFVQFKQKKGAEVKVASKERKQWDLKGFVEANQEVLTATGVNFFYASPAS